MSGPSTVGRLQALALALIRAYQSYLSPYKGFACAYRLHCGRAGCSALGYRAIRGQGLWRGLGVLRLRLRRCGEVHRRCRQRSLPGFGGLAAQRGFCDLGCDAPDCSACDAPDLRSFSRLIDSASCCDCCSCDWPTRRQNKLHPMPSKKTRRRESVPWPEQRR